jgi:hypothetical protein
MAIPTDLLRAKFGAAVMRYDHTAAEWFFVCWANNRPSAVLDLPVGNHTFALWLICGDLAGPGYIEYEGWSSISAMRARR